MKKRVRLCMKDLFHQDVVEMIERETRKYELWSVDNPDAPEFDEGYQLLWDTFGPTAEMERKDVLRKFLRDDPFEPEPSGTYMRYFFLVARGEDGKIRGVRDGTVLVNPAYAPDLCVVYLAHIYMKPEARGTVLSYWLRISPVEIAMQFLLDLHTMGKIALPAPNAPGKYFGMRMNLTAESEYFSPEEPVSWQRMLFYGRGGFDAINPRHFPYRQPDFREPEQIRETGNRPLPLVLLVRRMGRERQAQLPIDEARALMRLLYDDFADHCAPELLENSLQLVLDRLEERARRKKYVELLPLPSGPGTLHRLKPLFRYSVFNRYYPNDPIVVSYLNGPMREQAKNPRFLDEQLTRIGQELEGRPRGFVYGSRDKDFTWEGTPLPPTLPERDQDAYGPDTDRPAAMMIEEEETVDGEAAEPGRSEQEREALAAPRLPEV
ncbi:Hypothetical protein CAP_2488 [Chondromyces apiculatus DSM 436]|uniref:Uncharacterized protein n=2 Tax=Chondromyces apiculatus TaxID=51 RepID=A0A017T9U7_9BACT|nr:Hypothetical protein CAP_2488 [Chondromyces apiculatus DSM 436]